MKLGAHLAARSACCTAGVPASLGFSGSLAELWKNSVKHCKTQGSLTVGEFWTNLILHVYLDENLQHCWSIEHSLTFTLHGRV